MLITSLQGMSPVFPGRKDRRQHVEIWNRIMRAPVEAAFGQSLRGQAHPVSRRERKERNAQLGRKPAGERRERRKPAFGKKPDVDADICFVANRSQYCLPWYFHNRT